MYNSEIQKMLEILHRQGSRISSSKEEAEKFLTELGIMHLLVPIEAKKSREGNKSKVKGK